LLFCRTNKGMCHGEKITQFRIFCFCVPMCRILSTVRHSQPIIPCVRSCEIFQNCVSFAFIVSCLTSTFLTVCNCLNYESNGLKILSTKDAECYNAILACSAPWCPPHWRSVPKIIWAHTSPRGRFSHGKGAVDWLHSVGPFMRKHVPILVLGVAYLWHSLRYCTLIIQYTTQQTGEVPPSLL